MSASCLQDVLFPVEDVVRAGGYVVHQVTAADSLKTGDQVQLHLDQVTNHSSAQYNSQHAFHQLHLLFLRLSEI